METVTLDNGLQMPMPSYGVSQTDTGTSSFLSHQDPEMVKRLAGHKLDI